MEGMFSSDKYSAFTKHNLYVLLACILLTGNS